MAATMLRPETHGSCPAAAQNSEPVAVVQAETWSRDSPIAQTSMHTRAQRSNHRYSAPYSDATTYARGGAPAGIPMPSVAAVQPAAVQALAAAGVHLAQLHPVPRFPKVGQEDLCGRHQRFRVSCRRHVAQHGAHRARTTAQGRVGLLNAGNALAPHQPSRLQLPDCRDPSRRVGSACPTTKQISLFDPIADPVTNGDETISVYSSPAKEHATAVCLQSAGSHGTG